MIDFVYGYCREVVEICGRDSPRGEGAGVRDTNRLLGLQKRERGIRRSAVPWIRRGARLQCLRATPLHLEPHLLPRPPRRVLREIPRCFIRWRLPLRSTGTI